MWSCSYFMIDRNQNIGFVMHQPCQAADSTWTIILYELLSPKCVHSILLQNESFFCGTHMIVSRSIIGSPKPRQLNENEEPNRCILFCASAFRHCYFSFCENEELLLDVHSLGGYGNLAHNGSYIEAHNHWYCLEGFLMTYTSHFSFMVDNRMMCNAIK